MGTALRDGLERELMTVEASTTFERARLRQPELQRYPTLGSMCIALNSRTVSHELRDRLLRALVAMAQACPSERLWKQVLALTFLPGLARTRSRTVAKGHEPDDLDALLWAAFFEVVQRYPLHRRGSVGAGLVLDTRKRYFAALRDERERVYDEMDLVAYALRTGFALAEHQAPAVPDREELRAALTLCATMAREDLDLLLATDVDGKTIPEFMSSREWAGGDEHAKHRERARLWRRRRRARERLRGALSRRIRKRKRSADAAEHTDELGLPEAFSAMMV